MTDLFDSAQPGASARREAERLEAARLRHDPSAPPSAWERGFRQGGEGEKYLGERLNGEAARRGGVGVLHDLVLPGKKANIDHVVVGPSGVTIIDAKAWSGRIWVGRAVIGQGRRGRRKPLDGISHQLHRVHTLLASGGRDDVTVQPVLCFVNDNRGLASGRLQEVGGVRVGTVRPVIDLAMRPGPHDLADVQALYELLASGFVVQGGGIAPTAPSIAPELRRAPRPRKAPRAARSRWRRALARGVAQVALVGIGFAVLLGMLSTMADSVRLPPAKLTRHHLQPLLPAIKRLAHQQARGPVRRVAIVTHVDRFVVRFRHGPRCVVAITVPRTVASPLAGAEASSSHCKRKAAP